MKTRRALQARIELLQEQLKTMDVLCKNVPEKYAVCFDTMYISSGYSMGEVVRYSIKDEVIMEDNNCREYAGQHPYKAKHGLIVIDFKTKKQLKEYCTEQGHLQWLKRQSNLYKNRYEELKSEEIFCKYNGYDERLSECLNKKEEVYKNINKISKDINNQVYVCKELLIKAYDKNKSVVKSLHW